MATESHTIDMQSHVQLYRVDICHSRTGVCLFEKVWQWNDVGTSDMTGICNLVLALNKFGREIAAGGLCSLLLSSITNITSNINITIITITTRNNQQLPIE
jgi:hypothetical protein